MSSIDISTTPNITTRGLSAKMGVGNAAGLAFLDPLALNNPLAVEDIVYYKNGSDVLYKGVIQTMDHSLADEDIDSDTIGVEDYINSQPWESQHRFYNDNETTCTVSINNATIQDFIDREFVAPVTDWFTAIEIVGAGIGDLPIPRLDLQNIGFMDAIQSVLQMHPFLRWTIEYSNELSIFPAGKIVIFNSQEGRDAHILEVGEATGTVTALDVTKSAVETAKHIEVHARGKFTERFEVVQPFWSPAEESVPEFGVQFPMPTSSGSGVQIPNGHDFPQTVHLFAVNVEADYAAGGIIHQTAFRIFPGSDYIIDMETGQITFLTPDSEDGAWPWVDAETGEMTSGDFISFGGIAVGLTNARRPVAFMDNHINEDGGIEKQVRAFYFRPDENAYKLYRTRFPIADFRLRKEFKDGVVAIPNDDEFVFRKDTESVTIYVPNLERIEESDPEIASPDPRSDSELGNQMFDPDWVEQDNAADGTWYRQDPHGNTELAAPIISPLSGFLPSTITQFTAAQIQRYFTKISGSASFEEGDQCIKLSTRQLAAYPKVYTGASDDDSELPQTGLGGGLAAGLDDTLRIARARWISWPVVAHYTAWEECIEERTTDFGGERYYRGIVDSVFKYTDLTGLSQITGTSVETSDPPYVIFDNTGENSTHSKIADDSEDYFGTPYWTGRITIALLRVGQTPSDPASGQPFDMPYKIGDICTLNGAVSIALKSEFRGLIVAINYDKLAEGVLDLEFGRREPRLNPFLPRDELPLNIENDNLTGTETAGMRKLGGSQ